MDEYKAAKSKISEGEDDIVPAILTRCNIDDIVK